MSARDTVTSLAAATRGLQHTALSADTIAVIGLGYVGLPLAVAFGKRYPTIGFDLSREKVDAYRNRVDPTGEVTRPEFDAAHLSARTECNRHQNSSLRLMSR